MIHLQMLWAFVTNHPVALLLCVVVYMAIGSVWYGPLFSKKWAALTGMDKVSKEDMKKAMGPAMASSLITAFVQATVMGRGLEILDMSSWTYPLIIATILWLPFTALPMAQNYAYTRKSSALLFIDAGYMLVSMWAMSMILYFTAL
jgi:hypothetical protein